MSSRCCPAYPCRRMQGHLLQLRFLTVKTICASLADTGEHFSDPFKIFELIHPLGGNQQRCPAHHRQCLPALVLIAPLLLPRGGLPATATAAAALACICRHATPAAPRPALLQVVAATVQCTRRASWPAATLWRSRSSPSLSRMRLRRYRRRLPSCGNAITPTLSSTMCAWGAWGWLGGGRGACRGRTQACSPHTRERDAAEHCAGVGRPPPRYG